jgi:hypothetical protein
MRSATATTGPDTRCGIICVETSFQGKATDGVRLKPIVPKPAVKDDLNDEISF